MLTRYGIALQKHQLTQEENIKLRTQLTVEPETNEYQQSIPYKIYSESQNYLFVPRNFKPSFIDIRLNENRLPDGIKIACHFNGVLNEKTNQPDASNAVYNGLMKKGEGILNLPTGYGKTTVALHLISRIQRKTLIVVHKEFLMNQWVEKINQFLPNMRLGKIQGNVVDVENKDIVIGMLQSLSKKDYDKSVFNDFGFTIIDEVHHICTRSFSKFLMKHNTKLLLGLSATIERKDGLTYVLHYFLGDVLFKKERVNQKQVVIHKVDVNCEDFKNVKFPTNRMLKPNFPEAINILTSLTARNDMILNIIQESLEENRKVIILTDRRSHCEYLHTTMQSQHINSGLYLGGMKQSELSNSEKCDVLVGTYALANEGLDIPILDTLILATPKSDVVQSVGRILRETKDKKNIPVVYDMVDNWGSFKHQFYKRKKFYNQSGFKLVSRKDEPVETEHVSFMFMDDEKESD